MIRNGKSAKALVVAISISFLLLASCLNKNNIQDETSFSAPVPQEYTVSTGENVINNVLKGEISEKDLIYLDTEKHIALKETDFIINRGDDSSFWVMTTFKDLIAGEKYNFRYEIYTTTNKLFRSESFTFSPEFPEYTTWITEKLNTRDWKKLSTGTWSIKIYINNTLLSTKNISIISTTPDLDVILKEYKWKNFQFQYPDYCTIEEDKDIVDETGREFRLVKLRVSNKHRIGLFLYFAGNWTPSSNDTSWQSPAMTNMILGLPIALKHAEPVGAEAISLSVGSIELIDGFDLATRFVIVKPESETFSSLECFHKSLSDKMFFGILFTQGYKGKGPDTPEYFRLIQDAYSIIRSISTPELMFAPE